MYKTVSDIRRYFVEELIQQRFTIDKTGAKTIEIIGASFVADEPAIFGKPNESYIARELAWYESESTNIYDIYGDDRDAPEAWKYAANHVGEINSNYGKLIYSPLYYNQYERALSELVSNADTRRASMIYTRPSIWEEYCDSGKSDFICTNSVTYYVRDNVLECVVQMRSNDVVYGYKNDSAWQKYVLQKLASDLSELTDENIIPGKIIWQVQNLHVYEKHFNLVKL
jgi:thymidylate synthase